MKLFFALMTLAFALMALACLTGCTFLQRKETKQEAKLGKNTQAITEESRALITGTVDSLSVAPTNPPTALALDLARRAQDLQGLPLERIDIQALLAHETTALETLEKRFAYQDQLRAEKAQLEKDLEATRQKLVAMGQLYEQERNKSIVKRCWHWAVGTFGLLGAIAFMVFCPAVALPLFGRIAGWLVNTLPALGSFFGVVAKKTWDRTIAGVAAVREHLHEKAPVHADIVDALLKQNQDVGDRNLIRATRSALNVT